MIHERAAHDVAHPHNNEYPRCADQTQPAPLTLPVESEATLAWMDAVEVRRSPRARQWRLEVPWGKLARLTVPQWTTRAEIERVLAERRSWIDDQRRRQVPRLGSSGSR